MTDLKPGWDVLTNDDHRIGRIREVGQHFVEVSAGHFSSPLYVPSSAIANVGHEAVYLNVANGEVDAMGWRERPRLPDALQTSPQPDADREI